MRTPCLSTILDSCFRRNDIEHLSCEGALVLFTTLYNWLKKLDFKAEIMWAWPELPEHSKAQPGRCLLIESVQSVPHILEADIGVHIGSRRRRRPEPFRRLKFRAQALKNWHGSEPGSTFLHTHKLPYSPQLLF